MSILVVKTFLHRPVCMNTSKRVKFTTLSTPTRVTSGLAASAGECKTLVKLLDSPRLLGILVVVGYEHLRGRKKLVDS